MGLPWTNNEAQKSNKKNMSAPKTGSYAPPKAEQARHTTEAWAQSNSPGPDGHSNRVASKQPAQKGPWESTSDNARAKELLASDTSTRKPSIFK